MRRAIAAALLVVGGGCGELRSDGQIEGARLPEAVVEAKNARQGQILFGDLHVHTTFSADAFERSLPINMGEGAHPPADACDFARYCAALDFWSINDHAGMTSPRMWREIKSSIRECNARAGDPANPDMVSFLGFEWTQIGATPETHYGHKNVMFLDTADDRVPARAIAAGSGVENFNVGLDSGGVLLNLMKRPLLDFENRDEYLDNLRHMFETQGLPACPADLPSPELPGECQEIARTPDVLFEKLDQWNVPTLVLPHGNAWGMYTPPGSTWAKQLSGAMHDPARQTLIEVFSGHGNSEEHRAWRGTRFDAAGEPFCPEPMDDYLPCCWRAGEIIRERCQDPSSAECDERVAEARRNHVLAGASGLLTIEGEGPEDWQGCGQCTDCFLPAFNYRPGTSVQAAVATTGEDGKRFRFGFLASSDNHSARPGTGYKEYGRHWMTDLGGPVSEAWAPRIYGERGPESPRSRHPSEIEIDTTQSLFGIERATSFMFTGGLVAVHAAGRSREAIWEALERKRVYGTSGPRILLWFELLHENGILPMGSETISTEAPRFRVRAAGGFRQQPGCPAYAHAGLSPERLERLCRGECQNPGDVRHPISRIEVIRIRPQQAPGEPLAPLIEDPWLTLACPGDAEGCSVEFEDPEFAEAGRDSVYYVRALQEPTPAVRGNPLVPCPSGYLTPPEEDCLAPVEERAWSSPIYVDFPRSVPAASAIQTRSGASPHRSPVAPPRP